MANSVVGRSISSSTYLDGWNNNQGIKQHGTNQHSELVITKQLQSI